MSLTSTPPPNVLALDLKGTLISNAMSQIARPGLKHFLERCQELFPRVVMFTTVSEDHFRSIAKLLVSEGVAPSWFVDLEYIHWEGTTKDLNFIPGAVLSKNVLVDDFEQYVYPGQYPQWLRIKCFEHPYESSDSSLLSALLDLEALFAPKLSL